MKKVLLVDDSDTIRDELKNIIATKEDVGVCEAVNGLEGLQRLEEDSDIGLMIVDVNMPEMDGITMIKRIASEGKHSSIPIVMLTTEASPEMKEEAKQNGVKAWILKPFNEKKIMLVIDKFLLGL